MRERIAVSTKLQPEGTRVILLQALNKAGTITAVRREPYLKPYVVKCDDGTEAFASHSDLAREDDASRTPLGPPIHG